jgi:hypothetical protein
MPQALRWKLLPLAFVLALVAAACAEPPTPSVDVGSGLRFLPEVADSLNDAGRYPSIVTNPDGLPVVAYFGFEEKLEEGEVPISRPVGSPSVPGVFLAGLSDQGYWTRGAIAIAGQIPNVSIAFNAAERDGSRDGCRRRYLSRGLGIGRRCGLRDRIARSGDDDPGAGHGGVERGREWTVDRAR